MTSVEEKARNRRNVVIALALGAFVIVVFFVSVAQMRAGMLAGAGQ